MSKVEPVRSLLLDLDEALTSQSGMQRRLLAGHMVRVDARDLAPQLRIFARSRALKRLTQRIEQSFALAQGAAPLIFYSSGDFHHLAALFVREQAGPLLVLHIDNHPDWTVFPKTWNCGAWVNRALEMPQVERVVTIGPASSDMENPWLKSANLDAIRQGRLEVYPWRAPPGIMWGQPVISACCWSKDRRLFWRSLETAAWSDFVEELDRRLPGIPFWVSLDKDALIPSEAVTNWDHGGLELDRVVSLVRQLAKRRRLLGMDVCGDYSRPVFGDPVRTLLAAIDRPRLTIPPAAVTTAVNDDTNIRIMQAADAMAAEGLWTS
jgi:arginase family enzyme